MTEIWLKTNHRALWFGTVPPLLIFLLGLGLAGKLIAAERDWIQRLGIALTTVGSGGVVVMLMQMRKPRIAWDGEHVLFYLRMGPPIEVPAVMVEAFFLGQGPLMLPGSPQQASTTNLVARISQRDLNYAEREVKPALGCWRESYVTIRGTWCEPLHAELIRRLNRRLREVTEEQSRNTFSR